MKYLVSASNEKKPCFLLPSVEVTYFATEDDVIRTSSIELPSDDFDNPNP